MRYLTFLSVLTCAAVTVSYRPAMAETSGADLASICSQCESHWTAEVGSVYLHRSNAEAGMGVFGAPSRQGRPLVETVDFDLGWAAGPQVEVTRHFDLGWDVGVRYFDVDGWNAAHDLGFQGTTRMPSAPSSLGTPPDTSIFSYSSQLYSAEINIKRQVGERLRPFVGFRMIELGEQVPLLTYSNSQLDSVFEARTTNDLYGCQIGTEAMLFRYGSFHFDGILNAGVYGNCVRETLDTGGVYYSAKVTQRHTSFLGEIGLTANYRFNRHWSVSGGYEAMWLQGVVLAGDYFTSTSDPSITDRLFNGAAFYHGATGGLEFAW